MSKRIEIPEIVPPQCNDCDYFIRDDYWIIESYLGRCEFYDEKSHCYNECIAVTRYGYSLTPNKESTKIENNNQKPICPNCNKPQNDNATFCKDCGTEISPKELVTIAYCDKCESEFDESYQFCEEDGNQLVLKKKEFDESPQNIESVKTSKNIVGESNNFVKDKVTDLPMNWYKFITYLLFPVAILGYLYLAVEIGNDTVTVSLLFGAVFGAVIIYGLHNKTSWSWKLLIISYILNISTSRLDRVEDLGIFPYLIVVVIVNFIITYPNYIYFNKRKHLFNN
jgi:ribosomal protein L37AE/L43A